MAKYNDKIVKKHYVAYTNQPAKIGKLLRWDKIAYKKEIEFIKNFLIFLIQNKKENLKILDLGCGDGYTLERLVKSFPKNHYWGIDFAKELIGIAKNKKLLNCQFHKGDAHYQNYFQKLLKINLQ